MIKNALVSTVVLVTMGVCMITHPLYTLGACALVVGIANMVKVVRSR
jgi:uncharacterized membrane protein HdeD (DUF308 family)